MTNWARIFRHGDELHIRVHGPMGYVDYRAMKPWLRDEYKFRCVYCLDREEFRPDGPDSFAVDHAVAKSFDPKRACDYDNLYYSCNRCNVLKGTRTLPGPDSDLFGRMLDCQGDGTFVPLTDDGAELIEILDLNDPRRVRHRQRVITLTKLAEGNPSEADLLRTVASLLKYPDDLPDLESLRPPGGNSRPDGIQSSHFARRSRGELSERY